MQHKQLQKLLQPLLWLLPSQQHCLQWTCGFGLCLLLWLCFLNPWGGLGFELSDHVLQLALPEWKFHSQCLTQSLLWKQESWWLSTEVLRRLGHPR